MVSQAAPPPLDDQVRALEELRTADRLLSSVLGTLGFVKRQQLLDTVGFSTAEGFLGEQTRADVHASSRDLNEAQQALRRALELLGAHAETNWVELERWGVAEAVFNGVFDVFATMRAGRNVRAAEAVREQVRTLFATVRNTNPELSSRVAPLAEIEDADAIDSLRAQWQFNKSGLILRVCFFLVPAVAVLLGLLLS